MVNLNRREFLQVLGISSAGLAIPVWLPSKPERFARAAGTCVGLVAVDGRVVAAQKLPPLDECPLGEVLRMENTLHWPAEWFEPEVHGVLVDRVAIETTHNGRPISIVKGIEHRLAPGQRLQLQVSELGGVSMWFIGGEVCRLEA